jgi:hypothetical protein
MEHDADRNFPHSKNEPNSPTLNSQTLKNQLRKGAWVQRSFTRSTLNCFNEDHPPARFLRVQETLKPEPCCSGGCVSRRFVC